METGGCILHVEILGGGGGFEKSPNERSTVLISVVATLREEYIFLRDAAPRLREG